MRRGLVERLALHVESGADLLRIRVSEGLVTVSIVVIVGIFIIIITYQIIVADAADAVSVNFSGRCKFLQI